MSPKWIVRGIAAVLAVGLLATGCGGKRTSSAGRTTDVASITCESSDGRITIATGNSTGVYYVLGGGLAQLISNKTKLKATAAETGASGENIQQLVAGTYDIAFSVADVAVDAVQGKGQFDGKPQQIQALSRLYPNYTHVVARTDAGISGIADLRGKRVSTGSPKSSSEFVAHRLMEAAGLDPNKDVQAQRLDLGKTVDGMKNGTIDALIWSGGLPTPAITDLTTSLSDKVRVLDLGSILDSVKKINTIYEKGTIPAATYKLPADVTTMVVPNILLVRSDFPAGNACAITDAIFKNKADLEKVHPSAKDITQDKAANTDPVPLHPGARKALGK